MLTQGIYAQNLTIITGTNQVNVASNGDMAGISATTANAGSPAPGFALDVAALGGMYAGKITMIGTEAGLGVRNAGNIGASAGALTLSADGQLTSTGSMSASTDVLVNTNALNNQGTITAQNNLHMQSATQVKNSGVMAATRELTLATTGALDNTQGVVSAQRLEVRAASLINAQGRIEQTGAQNLTITAQSLSNAASGIVGNMPQSASTSGGTAGGTGTGGTASTNTGGGLTSTTLSNTAPPSTATSGGSVAVVPVAPVILADGMITIGGHINNDTGKLIANGNVDLTVGSALTHAGLINAGDINVRNIQVTGSTLKNSAGNIDAQQAHINTTQLTNDSGKIAADVLAIQAHDISNISGKLLQLGTSDLTINLAGDLNNHLGTIGTNANNFNLGAVNLTNTQGTISHVGVDALNLTATNFIGTQGEVITNGALNFNAQTATLDSGITSANQITINTQTLSNQAGRITQTGAGATQITASPRSLG